MAVQVKLLRLLQEGTIERVGGDAVIRINTRVVAATKQPLASLVEAKRFRQDFYYRLSVVPLHVPPLRERREDIPLLAEHFLEQCALRMNRDRFSITPEAVSLLQAHDWPGSVRELEHVLERMAALSTTGELTKADLPELASTSGPDQIVSLSLAGLEAIDMAAALRATEARLVKWALAKADGNVARAAELLSIPRSTFQYRLARLHEGAPSE